MCANRFGTHLSVTTFGESHSGAVGVVIDGVPAGLPVDMERLRAELARRRPGRGDHASARDEADDPEILSGVYEGKTLGTPIAILIRNTDARPEDYADLAALFRPGHGDYTWQKKYGHRDPRGGGRASGRETAARVAAGALALTWLSARGVTVTGYTTAVGSVRAEARDLSGIIERPWRFADPALVPRVEACLAQVAADRDSVGATVELLVTGAPAGLGAPLADRLDAALAGALMSVGAVKAVGVGEGFEAASLRGSENNDQMNAAGFASNHAGGILGGISTGQPILLRVAVKPVPTIGIPQQTLDTEGASVEFTGSGRHDRVLVPRILPVLEAMVALVLLDALWARDAELAAPDTMEVLRCGIDAVDDDLVELIARRLHLAQAIGEAKRARGLAVSDPSREAEVRRRWELRATGAGLEGAQLSALLDTLFGISKAVQKEEPS